ncbi:methyl-accepting chemotaxis protein, partial [Klebsiella pneumoniae]|nr:methyl-accepting chemotaxis protein [Klebsiella pneumoniae]
MPTSKDYLAKMQQFLDHQRAEIDKTAAAIDAANSSSRLLLMALGAVMVGVGCVTAWNITKGITAPLVAANGLAERVAEGNL